MKILVRSEIRSDPIRSTIRSDPSNPIRVLLTATWQGSIQQTFLCKNTHIMILFSNDLKWNNHVVCIRNSASFNNDFQIIWQSHIGFIIISYLFWMDIDMDFSIATASKNMLLSHKTAMWNEEFDGWINGWMDGLID